MFRKYLSPCSSCRQPLEKQLTLDCSHSICLQCLSNILLKNESQEMLTEQLEITCTICSYMTYISIPLVYKLTREVKRDGLSQLDYNNSKVMFCMDCIEDCFTLEEYLNGRHKGHKIKTVEQAAPFLTNILEYAAKELQQNVDNLYRQNEKLFHFKDLFNDILQANITKIKIGFETVKAEIIKKQQQMIQLYDKLSQQKIKAINIDLQQVRRKIQMGRIQLEWISQNVINRSHKKWSSSQGFSIANYFLKNYADISALTQFSDSVKLKIPSYLHLLKLSRDIIQLEKLKPLINQIRIVQIFQKQLDDQSTQISSSRLSRQYFDQKKAEVLGKIQSNQSLTFNNNRSKTGLNQRIQGIKKQFQRQKCSNRKAVAIKRNFYFNDI